MRAAASLQRAPAPPAPIGERNGWWTRIERSVALLVSVSTLAVAAFTWVSIRQVNSDQNLTREGQITDRYNAAVTNLGDASEDVRLGGIYALGRIMQDSPRDQPAVVSIICAFIRTHAPDTKTIPTPLEKAANDVIAATAILNDATPTELQAPLDLNHTFLPRADLRHADLRQADLVGADLAGANLVGADLTGADLSGAMLAGADLRGAHLSGAHLGSVAAEMNIGILMNLPPPKNGDDFARAPGANLINANLVDADLTGADLNGAILVNAHMHRANLADGHLSGANLNATDLRYADLTRANLNSANLSCADLRNASLRHADLASANLTCARLTGADLAGAIRGL